MTRAGSSSDGHTGVLYLGVDYLLSPTVLVGSLIQFDDTEQEFNFLSQRASTNGWMAGPYATVRLPHNLFFQARAAWGQSDNELTVAPGIEDEFDSERWLVKGTLLGQYKYGLWQFQPRASVGYIEEDQEAYTSSLGGVGHPEQHGVAGTGQGRIAGRLSPSPGRRQPARAERLARGHLELPRGCRPDQSRRLRDRRPGCAAAPRPG